VLNQPALTGMDPCPAGSRHARRGSRQAQRFAQTHDDHNWWCQHDIVDVPADGDGEHAAPPWLEASFPVFTAQVREKQGWCQLTEPQREPHTACMLLAAVIWRQSPGIALLRLQAQVEDALRRLDEGAREVTIGDRPHRVVRTDLFLDVPLNGPFTEPSGS
jgi:Family of unknown function (DUF5954)